MIKLSDFLLYKQNWKELSLQKASSGEQCMLLIMLGIAGHITDHSLIFIDEPEISMHPKWQEEFMPMLVKAFSQYKNCQFFIATHSPQIISNVSDENCFVTSLTKNEIYPSSFFRNRSSDFQLTELFDAPGYRNEYISRLAFGLLSKVKKQKAVTDDDKVNLEKLLGFIPLLEKDDPIHDLILSIKEVLEFYASNK
ncbi:ATP-binding protein [Parashewanella spongiae]|uniref:AAA family ATPase n=1 Tax=Parashewanella spongiae TaxID=342950 RepID=UPI001A9F3CB8|nr:AAA family ATPase [Parashewanella spongiae]MCL1078148.1 ATP-binding protein [Parashewanella spongiae]